MSDNSLDDFFLSYKKILLRLKMLNVKTKNGNEITHKDLRKAITIMNKKHPNCRWQSQKLKSKRYFILMEGFYWLIYVYFQKEKKQIDADIDFFELRIKQYEEILHLVSKSLFEKDIKKSELNNYFDRGNTTIKKAIIKMNKATDKKFNKIIDDEKFISKEGIEWLCKNCFKQKYLEILEQYKMELTELYIEKGYIYDNFFNKN